MSAFATSGKARRGHDEEEDEQKRIEEALQLFQQFRDSDQSYADQRAEMVKSPDYERAERAALAQIRAIQEADGRAFLAYRSDPTAMAEGKRLFEEHMQQQDAEVKKWLEDNQPPPLRALSTYTSEELAAARALQEQVLGYKAPDLTTFTPQELAEARALQEKYLGAAAAAPPPKSPAAAAIKLPPPPLSLKEKQQQQQSYWSRMTSRIGNLGVISKLGGVITSVTGLFVTVKVQQTTQQYIAPAVINAFGGSVAGAAATVAAPIGLLPAFVIGAGVSLAVNVVFEVLAYFRGETSAKQAFIRAIGRTVTGLPGLVFLTIWPGFGGQILGGTVTAILNHVFMPPTTGPVRPVTKQEAEIESPLSLLDFALRTEQKLEKELGAAEAARLLAEANGQKIGLFRALALKAMSTTIASWHVILPLLALGAYAYSPEAVGNAAVLGANIGLQFLKDLFVNWRDGTPYVSAYANQQIGAWVMNKLSKTQGKVGLVISDVAGKLLERLLPGFSKKARETKVVPETLRNLFRDYLGVVTLEQLTFAALGEMILQTGLQVTIGLLVQNAVVVASKWVSLEAARADLQRFYDGATRVMDGLRAGVETAQSAYHKVLEGGLAALSLSERLYDQAKIYLNLADQAAVDGAKEAATRLRQDAAELQAQGDAAAKANTPPPATTGPVPAPAPATATPAEKGKTRTSVADRERLFEERVFGLRQRLQTASHQTGGAVFRSEYQLQKFEDAVSNLRDYELQVNQQSGAVLVGTPLTDALLSSGLAGVEIEGLAWGMLKDAGLTYAGLGTLNALNKVGKQLDLAATVARFTSYYHRAKVDMLRAAMPPTLTDAQKDLVAKARAEGKSELDILTDPRLQPADSPEVRSHVASAAWHGAASRNIGTAAGYVPRVDLKFGDTFGGNMLDNMQLIMRLAGITDTRTDGIFEIMFGTTSARWLRLNAPALGKAGDVLGENVLAPFIEGNVKLAKLLAEGVITEAGEIAQGARVAAEAFTAAATPVATSALRAGVEGGFYLFMQSLSYAFTSES